MKICLSILVSTVCATFCIISKVETHCMKANEEEYRISCSARISRFCEQQILQKQ